MGGLPDTSISVSFHLREARPARRDFRAQAARVKGTDWKGICMARFTSLGEGNRTIETI